MHWRFDPLFSIKVYHSKYRPPKGTDFTLEPTKTSAMLLKKLGWIFRTQPGELTIYGEKAFETNGDVNLRSKPPFNESLTFLIKLNNAVILNETKPYVLKSKPDLEPNPSLPVFSGRSRLVYLDNLNASALSGGAFSLTAGPIDVAQMASNFPAKFTFYQAKSGVKTLKITSKTPKASTLQYPIDEQTNSAKIELPENAYQLEQNPGGFTETIVVLSENIEANVLGLVRIFPYTDGSWEPVRNYHVNFEAV
jgi:hypothetical protein